MHPPSLFASFSAVRGPLPRPVGASCARWPGAALGLAARFALRLPPRAPQPEVLLPGVWHACRLSGRLSARVLWGAPPLRRLWRGSRRRALGLCGALAGLSSLSGRPQSASAQVCAPGAASVLANCAAAGFRPRVRELGTAHVAAVPVRVRHVRVGVRRGRHAPWHVSPSAFAAGVSRGAQDADAKLAEMFSRPG